MSEERSKRRDVRRSSRGNFCCEFILMVIVFGLICGEVCFLSLSNMRAYATSFPLNGLLLQLVFIVFWWAKVKILLAGERVWPRMSATGRPSLLLF